MGKKKNLHPADIERRKAAKKNVERNRKIRQTQRETVLHSRSSVQLREEIHKMERLEKLGQGDDHGRARLKKLKQALDEALVREAAKAEEDKKKSETPDIVIKGLNKIVRRAAPTQDDMEDTQRTENDTSTNTTSQDMEPDDDMIIPEHIIKSTQAPAETSTSTAPSISTPAAPPPPPTPLLDLPPGLRIPPVGYVMDYLTPVAVGRGRGLPPAPGPAPGPGPGPAPVPFHHAPFPHPVSVPGMPLPMHLFPPPPAGRGIMMGRGQPVPVPLPAPPPLQPASRPPPPQPAPFTHHPHPHPHGPPPPAPPPVPSPAGEEHVPMWKRAAMAEQQARRDKGRKGQGQGQGQGRHGHSNKPWSSDELDPMDPNPETAHEAYRGRGRGPPPPPSSSGPYVPAPPPPLSAAGISGAQIRAEMAAAGTLPPSSKSDSSSSSLSTSTSTPAVATVTAPPSKALPTVSLGAAASFLPSSLLVKRSAPAAAVPPDVLRKRARTNIAPDVAGAGTGTGAATPAPAPSSAAPPPPPRKPASSVAAYDSFMRELEGLM